MSAPAPQPRPHRRSPVAPAALHLPLLALGRLLEILVVAIFIITFIVQPSRVPSPSMEPTLRVGDYFLLQKQTFGTPGPLAALLPPNRLQRGELIVFHYPPEPSVDLVKRVVALPGDRVHLHSGVLWINDHPVWEPYALHSAAPPDYFRDNFPEMGSGDPSLQLGWWAQLPGYLHQGELTVPPGQYFVLGDNRNASQDSRYWGFVPQQDIVGRPLLVYFSPQPAAPASSLPGRLRARFDTQLHHLRVLQ